MNQEMSGEAEKLAQLVLAYPAKASETGKLYGSISPQMIAETINQKLALELTRRQIDVQPIRFLGTHKVHVRLTVDLVPEVLVVVHREGEAPTVAEVKEEALPVAQPELVEVEAEPEGESS
jgi:large subunit ribosomal protein L9